MPGSRPHGKRHTKEWLRSLPYNPIYAMDVGTGDGKYLRLLYQEFNDRSRFYIEGIEVFYPYIKDFELEKKYDKIHNIDARCFDWSKRRFDVVFFGDVLEHMKKSEAVSLVKNASEHSKHVLINIPIFFSEQEPINGNEFERHIKPDWTHEEVMQTWPSLRRIDTSGKNRHLKGVYIMDGF